MAASMTGITILDLYYSKYMNHGYELWIGRLLSIYLIHRLI